MAKLIPARTRDELRAAIEGGAVILANEGRHGRPDTYHLCPDPQLTCEPHEYVAVVPWRASAPPAHEAERPGAPEIHAAEAAALDRLIAIAQTDTGQARKVAAFLLAWWNADTCGGFDLTDLWAVDAVISVDMLRVFAMVGRVQYYPDSLGYGDRFDAIVRQWRPHLLGGAHV